MEIKVKIDAKEVLKNLNKLKENSRIGRKECVKKAIDNTHQVAIKRTPINKGNLKQSYRKKIKDYKTVTKGEILLSNEYLWYVYFGTGKYAEKPGKGKNTWYVPLDKIDETSGNKYFNKTKDGNFWIVHGQKPKHFLHETMEITKKQNEDIVKTEYLLQLIKRI